MSQPPPESTESNPSTSLKNARSAGSYSVGLEPGQCRDRGIIQRKSERPRARSTKAIRLATGCAICSQPGSPERLACRPSASSVERQVRGPLPPDPAKRLAALERLDEEIDMSGRLRVEAAQPDRMHFELGRQQIPDLAGLFVATLSEVLHVFSPLRGSRPATRATSP